MIVLWLRDLSSVTYGNGYFVAGVGNGTAWYINNETLFDYIRNQLPTTNIMLEYMYPLHSLITLSNQTNPNTLLGFGTWTELYQSTHTVTGGTVITYTYTRTA